MKFVLKRDAPRRISLGKNNYFLPPGLCRQLSLDGIPPEGHNLTRRVKVKFLNYEVALDFAKEHPDATVKLDGKSYTVNGCLNCNALTADGEDWCSRCKEIVDANKEVNEAIFAATGVII